MKKQSGASLAINQQLSSKHEIVFTQVKNFSRIILKIKSYFRNEIKKKLQILVNNAEAANHILPFTLHENYLESLNYTYSILTYEQNHMKTLRQEIIDKTKAHAQFSQDEILQIFTGIEKSIQFLHKLKIFPSFITVDNICYIPDQPNKKWVLNIQNMFKYAEPNDIQQNQYFSCQLCEEEYEKLIKPNKLYKLPLSVIARENYINLGICLVQACVLEANKNQFCNCLHNNNPKIKTINYYHLCNQTLKLVQNTYESTKLGSLIKYLIFTPLKCIKPKDQTFLDYLPFLLQFSQIQELLNLKLHDQALQQITKLKIEWDSKIDSADILKLKIMDSQCLFMKKDNQQFLESTEEIFIELNKKFETNIEEQDFIVYFKLFYKHFLVWQNEEDTAKFELLLNRILNEIFSFYQKIQRKLKKSNQKALTIRNLQIMLQFLMQLFSQLSCKNPNISHTIEYFSVFTQICSKMCHQIINLMKSSDQFQNQIKKYFDFLKEIQSDFDFIARLNFTREEDDACLSDTENFHIETKKLKGKSKKQEKQQKKKLDFEGYVQTKSDIYPIHKQTC